MRLAGRFPWKQQLPASPEIWGKTGSKEEKKKSPSSFQGGEGQPSLKEREGEGPRRGQQDGALRAHSGCQPLRPGIRATEPQLEEMRTFLPTHSEPRSPCPSPRSAPAHPSSSPPHTVPAYCLGVRGAGMRRRHRRGDSCWGVNQSVCNFSCSCPLPGESREGWWGPICQRLMEGQARPASPRHAQT